MCRGVDDFSNFLSNTFLRNELFFWRGAEIKIIGQKRFVTQIYITLEARGKFKLELQVKRKLNLWKRSFSAPHDGFSGFSPCFTSCRTPSHSYR